MKVKMFCLGESVQLDCPKKTVLLIKLASISLVSMESSDLCTNKNHTASGSCNPMHYSRTLKLQCNGKTNCTIKNNNMGMKFDECKNMFVISVLYTCERAISNETSQTHTAVTKSTSKRQTSYHPTSADLLDTNTRPTSIAAIPRADDKKLNAMTYVFFTLLSTSTALEFIQSRPKHMILCIVLSVSAGIVLLIVVILLMVCVERFVEERKKEGDANQMEISLPLLVSPTTSNQITAVSESPADSQKRNSSSNAAKTLSVFGSEAGSSHREPTCATVPRLQSIYRRSHSVDEGTQTEARHDDVVDGHRISDSEAKELGYLVDIMKYYSNHKDVESGSIANNSMTTDKTETPTSRPRIVDTSRARQARLSSATYSSSNNSVFGGENQVTTANHVSGNASSSSPHMRHKATSRFNSFGHNHTLGPYTLENGVRRPHHARTRAGYTGTASERVSDRISYRPYGTLS
eukprot:gene541-1195_t